MSVTAYAGYEDSELVTLLQKGDAHAFTCLYDRYWEKLFAIAYYHCRNKETAAEIVQEIFTGLWDRKAVVVIQSIQAYLATAVKFSVFRELKKENRRKQLREHYLKELEQTSAGNEQVDAVFLQHYIQGRVEQLPCQCRVVYKYSREQGLSVPQIAEIMQLSPKTVENHLTRALTVLRSLLKTVRLWGVVLVCIGHWSLY